MTFIMLSRCSQQGTRSSRIVFTLMMQVGSVHHLKATRLGVTKPLPTQMQGESVSTAWIISMSWWPSVASAM